MAIVSSCRGVFPSVGQRAQPLPYVKLFIRDSPSNSREEGGDDVKSARPLCPGLHTCYNEADKGLPKSNLELIPSNGFSVGIEGCNSPS